MDQLAQSENKDTKSHRLRDLGLQNAGPSTGRVDSSQRRLRKLGRLIRVGDTDVLYGCCVDPLKKLHDARRVVAAAKERPDQAVVVVVDQEGKYGLLLCRAGTMTVFEAFDTSVKAFKTPRRVADERRQVGDAACNVRQQMEPATVLCD